MGIPFLYPDNPLSSNHLPDTPLTVQLPAHGFVMPEGETRSWSRVISSAWVHFIVLGCCIALVGSIASSDARFATRWLYPFEIASVYGLALAILLRPLFRSGLYSVLLITAAHMTTLIVVTCAMIGGTTHGRSLSILIVEWFLLMAMEMGFHFFVLSQAKAALEPDQANIDALPFRRLMALVGIASLLMFALANSTIPLIGMWTTALIAIAVGLFEGSQRFKHTAKAMFFHVRQFFFYPIPAELAPGLIPSPAGHYFLRTALVSIPLAAFLCLAAFTYMQGQSLVALGWFMLPPVFFLAAACLVTGLVAPATTPGQQAKLWHQIVKSCRDSDNAIERNAIFLGHVAADHSPVFVDRSLFFQHAHFLGSTGSGKTSIGLSPVVEQLISFGDSTIIIADLKADTLELYAAAEAAVKRLERERNIKLPIRVFSLENGAMTHAFNPFLTTGWTNLSILEKTDIICSSAGLAYGFDYGPSFFTSANSAVITAANLANPDAMTFRQLHQDVVRLMDRNSRVLHPEFRKAGVHALEVIGRLASYEALNVTAQSGYDPSVLANQIDVADCFQKPQILYFRLPSSVASIGAPSVARLILYYLLIAGKSAGRRVKVHVVIDEFQRMATESMDHMLQMARSLDVSLILANQSLNDIKIASPKIYSALATNCAIRQWFSVTGVDDIAMVEKLMGTREQLEVSEIHGPNGRSYSYRTEHVPRARVTDLHAVSEDPRLSILHVNGSGRGYARYCGIPFVCQSDFHITKKQYEERRKLAWPSDLAGMMLAKESLEWQLPGSSKGHATPRPDTPPDTWNPNLFE